LKSEAIITGAPEYSVSHFIDCKPTARRVCASLIASRDAADQIGKITGMSTIETRSKTRSRDFGATLFGAALGLAMAASALAAEPVTLRVGDQKGGNRSLLEIAGLAKDLPYKIEWSEFPAAAPILEALNAGALDAVHDLVQRLNKARLWSLDHLPEYAKNTAELTKLPEDVLLSAYTAQRTSPIAIDADIVKEVQAASDRATRYGILSKSLDVSKAVDRSFTAAAAGSN